MVDFRLNDEQTEYQKLAREVAQKQLAVNAHKYDIAAEPTVEPLHQIWESGLANVQIDSEQGGLGLGTWDAVVVAEELAAGCSGITAPLEASSLAILPVLKFGSAKQQEALLKPLVDNFGLAALPINLFCNPTCTALKAIKSGSGFVLNGEVAMLSNASTASWAMVAASTDSGMTLLVVPLKSPGVESVGRPYLLGRRASDVACVRFKDVMLTAESVIGEEDKGASILETVRSVHL